MSVAIEFDLAELARSMGLVVRARGRLRDTRELMDGLASLLEQQTKRRISDEKTDPDGNPWDAWSEEYAKTREPHHSLLIDTQNLLDSITGTATARTATVGSELVYARRQNVMREFIGISEENRAELDDAVSDWLREAFA